MAMIQPIAQSVSAFDARNNNIFKFVSVGGNQVVANRLVIRRNDTNEIVYNKKIETYKFEHELLANNLTNGVHYNFYFQTYDILDNESPISNVITFVCYSRPTLEITNIPIDGAIDSSNFVINIRYNQDEGELLDSVKVRLLDEIGNQLFESKSIYKTDKPPIDFKYNLTGLNDNTTYLVYVTGNTINGTKIESIRYSLTARYFSPAFSTLLELENNCKEGYVQLKNNFVFITSESNPSDIGTNPKYLKDGKLDLRENGTYLDYVDGFNIKKDFTLRLFAEKPNLGTLATLTSGTRKVKINLVQDYPYLSKIKKYCLELECYDDIKEPYFIYSNYIDNINKIFIWLRRRNNIYEIKIEDLFVPTLVDWKNVRKDVRANKGDLYPVGKRFIIPNSEFGNMICEVIDHNTVKNPNNLEAPSLTFEMVNCLEGFEFDASELSEINGKKNIGNRHLYGSNIYRDSAIYQYLNSTGKNWWKAKNEFDQPPSYVLKDGFLTGFNQDFIDVLSETEQTCALDINNSYKVKSKFYLLSMSQINYGMNGNVQEDEPLEKYKDETLKSSDRIKLNKDGHAKWILQRSAYLNDKEDVHTGYFCNNWYICHANQRKAISPVFTIY